MSSPDTTRILDATVDIVVNDGFDAVSIGMLAARAGLSRDEVMELVGTVEHAVILMLERERRETAAIVLDNIERDPLGGLLSRVYYYTLSAVYERPITRALYLSDPQSMRALIRAIDRFELPPQIAVRTDFVQRMIEVGMIRPGTDATLVSGMLETFSAGLALTSPRDDYDLVTKAIELVLVTMFDASPRDTSAGKNAYRAFVDASPSLLDGAGDGGSAGYADED